MVNVFCEGLLDEIVIRHIIEVKTTLFIGNIISGKGKPYLKKRAKNLNLGAAGHPILLLADQDDPNQCATNQIVDWLGPHERHENLLIRFAKNSIEAWLLADAVNLANFLEIETRLITRDPEGQRNPKLELINLARRSRSRKIREAIVPDPRSGAVVGPSYNAELGYFAQKKWNVDTAAENSDSLNRLLRRLGELEGRIAR